MRVDDLLKPVVSQDEFATLVINFLKNPKEATVKESIDFLRHLKRLTDDGILTWVHVDDVYELILKEDHYSILLLPKSSALWLMHLPNNDRYTLGFNLKSWLQPFNRLTKSIDASLA